MGNPETKVTLGYNIVQRQANENKMKKRRNTERCFKTFNQLRN